MTTLKDRLKEVRRLIEQGWIQGSPIKALPRSSPNSEPTYAYCLLGAVDAVCGVNLAEGPGWIFTNQLPAVAETLRIALLSQLRDDPSKGFYSEIVHFNDTPGRTKEDVLALIDKTLAAMED